MQQEMGVSSLNLPVKPDLLILFIAHLYCRGYASSTVLTNISAIGYVHRLAGLPDPTESHLIKTALKGYVKLAPSIDKRLPITLPILLQLGNAFNHTLSSLCKIRLFKAMCALAFFAALRVGEITSRTNTPPSRILKLDQLSFLRNRDAKIETVKITMRNFKHGSPFQPSELLVHSENTAMCPVSLLSEYIAVRGSRPGPLFVHTDGSAVAREFFTTELQKAPQFCKLDPTRYKTHSFRIGAASLAAAKGFSDAQIRQFGRWKSSAFLKYIRNSSLSTQSTAVTLHTTKETCATSKGRGTSFSQHTL